VQPTRCLPIPRNHAVLGQRGESGNPQLLADGTSGTRPGFPCGEARLPTCPSGPRHFWWREPSPMNLQPLSRRCFSRSRRFTKRR
jgi:hypothetical protein